MLAVAAGLVILSSAIAQRDRDVARAGRFHYSGAAPSSLREARGERGKNEFVAGFESGTYKPWKDLQYEYDRPQSDSFQIVTSPVRQGRYAAKFIARQGYSPFGYGEGTELCCGPTPHEVEGSDYWYAWSTLFPIDWRPPYRWSIFAQWHSDFGLPPPLSLHVSYTSVSVALRSGAVTKETCDSSGCGNWRHNRIQRILDTISTGQWNDFVVHVRWSAYAKSSVEVWHRLAYQPRFRKVMSLFGVPTLQRYGTTTSKNWFKLGLYRGSFCSQPTQLGCTSPLGVQPDSVVYHDSFVRATAPFPWCRECRSPSPAS